MTKSIISLALAAMSLTAVACSSGIDNKRLEAAADSLRTAGVADSLATLGARALLMESGEFAELQARMLVSDLAAGRVSAESASRVMNETYAVAKRVGRDDSADAYFAALDRLAAELPLEQQMAVYINATTPRALGEALRKEFTAPAPDGDRSLVERQIAMARSMYSGADLDAFNAALAAE